MFSVAAVGLACLVAQNSGGEAEVVVPVGFFVPGGGWSPLAAGRVGCLIVVAAAFGTQQKGLPVLG